MSDSAIDADRPGEVVADVLIGEGNWLFLWGGAHKQFDYLLGRLEPDPSSVTAFVANLANRRAICAERGLPYVHVVFPSKPVVMTEFLPGTLRDQIRSLFLTHYAEAAADAGTNALLYPRDALCAAKREGPVFLQQDTHMAAAGSALVSRLILDRLGYDHDPIRYMKETPRFRPGDLARRLRLDVRELENNLRPHSTALGIFDNRPSLPGNTDHIIVVHNPKAASQKRLLALGDSFLEFALVPLATFFSDILYVRSAVFQPELLDLFAPDVVVTANTERYLSKVQADTEANSILAKYHGRPDYSPAPEFRWALNAQLAFRHYPGRYREWTRSLEPLIFPGVGEAFTNSQLIFLSEDRDWMKSTGIDPKLTFRKTAMADGTSYRLKITMDSTVHSIAQLFISHSEGKSVFSEDWSVRTEVRPGTNQLVFDLPAAGRGQRIRFDPLSCPGQIRITNMELHPAPDLPETTLAE